MQARMRAIWLLMRWVLLRSAAWGQRGPGQQQQHQTHNQNQNQARQGGPGDWRAVVRDDMRAERPMWPLTCYAHERGGANDLLGDVSFEEVGRRLPGSCPAAA